LASLPDAGGAWISLAAVEMAPIMIAITIFRRTRGGFRSFAGARAPEVSLVAAVWLLACVLVLSLLGAVLRATTHNHQLAGATYAIVATTICVTLIPACARLVEIALAWLQHGDKTRLFFALILAGTCVALVALRLVHALSAFALAAIVASHPQLGARRSLALVGPPASVALFALGMHHISALLPALADHAPIFSAAVDLIARR
jgi:hypothetical protein